MRVVVVGGTGFLGSRTVAALRRFPKVTVEVASRRGPVVIDLARPETFAALRGADVVIDLTDGTRSRPDALAAFCLDEGLTLIEATSDAEAVRRLREQLSGRAGPGRVVLGGGIFTGVSNLLAREVARRVGEGCTLTWAVSSSPYSGAGTGTISLMVDSAARPAVKTEAGARLEVPLQRGPTLALGGRERPTLLASLAEAEMLPYSTGASSVAVYFAPRPAFLVWAFVALPRWLLVQAWFRALFTAYFVLLRKVLLRGVSSAVFMLARAERDGRREEREVLCDDGMEAGAWALAAMAEAVVASPPRPGLSFIDDAVTLEAVVRRVNEVAARAVLTTR